MFTLDEQLKKDTILVGEKELCLVLLANDTNYPWVILVPKREDITEIYQLSKQDQQLRQQESCDVAKKLQQHFKGDKMNVAALGNVVKQLHIHHVVRYENDVAWPAPIWGKVAAKPYTPAQMEEMYHQLQALLL